MLANALFITVCFLVSANDSLKGVATLFSSPANYRPAFSAASPIWIAIIVK